MKKNKEILFMEPVLKEYIWGGERLATEYGYNIPGPKTGECWAISAHPNGDCRISEGEYKGQYLSALWNEHRELFGDIEGDRYPLLIKIIDANDDLSIQVHPDDEYARIYEDGSLGKTECWYILDCEEDSNIIIGHNANNKEELQRMIDNKEWDTLIRKVPVKKGDFFQIEPGVVHAILGRTLVLETQQNSDITYRLYDFDRLSNGVPRELHIDKSIDVIRTPYEENIVTRNIVEKDGHTIEELVKCPYYYVNKLEQAGVHTYQMNDSFLNVSVIEGTGNIDGRIIRKGDHFIIPAGYGEYTIEGEMSLIISGV